MIDQLVKWIWKFLDVIFYVLGLGSVIYGAFLIGKIVGFLALGGVLLLTGWFIDHLPGQN